MLLVDGTLILQKLFLLEISTVNNAKATALSSGVGSPPRKETLAFSQGLTTPTAALQYFILILLVTEKLP